MLNDIKILTNVASINNYDVISLLELREGTNPVPFYIQLWQKDLGMRYMPQGTGGGIPTVTIEFLRADTIAATPVSQTVSLTATQSFTDDRSIWGVSLSLANIAKIVSGGFRITVTENASPNTITTILFSNMTIRKLPSSESA